MAVDQASETVSKLTLDDEASSSGKEELEDAFNEAAECLATAAASGISLPNEDLLQLYGLYKQVTCGPCTSHRPSFFDIKKRSKWAAWKDLDDMPKEQAQVAYLMKVDAVLPDRRSKAEKEKGSASGAVVSTLMSSEAELDPLEGNTSGEMDSLLKWASEGDARGVGDLLNTGKDVNLRDQQGCSALHWACDRGHADVARVLLERGADPNLTNEDGQTALHFAALCDHKEIYALLLEWKADPRIQDSDGNTAQDLS